MPPKQTVIDIDESKLKSILEKVEARIPPKPKQGMTLREVINKSKVMINLALKRGYTYEEIAAILSEEGISIKAATLKQYLAESKSKKSKTATPPLSAVESTTETASVQLKPDIKPETKSDIKPETKPESKPKSVVRGKFADVPSNDEL